MKIKIIHISDLHFPDIKQPINVDDKSKLLNSNDYKGYRCIDHFKKHLKKIALLDFDKKVIVVSGDLTKSGNVDNLKECAEFLKECARILKITNNDVIIAPGNHDIERHKKQEIRWEKFKEYTQDFCTPFSSSIGWQLENKILIYPFISTEIRFKECSKIRKIFYKCINKLFNKAKGYEEIGIIGEKQLDAFDDKATKSKCMINIAVLHHHLVPVYGMETKTFEMVFDSGKVIRRLQENNCSIVLHGHKHNYSAKFIRDMEIEKFPLGMYVIGSKNLSSNAGWFNEINIYFKPLPEISLHRFHIENMNILETGQLINCTPDSKLLAENFNSAEISFTINSGEENE